MAGLDFVVVFIDLETVQPTLKRPTGVKNKDGIYTTDPCQMYCSRIWQLACVSQTGQFVCFIHPGIPLEKLEAASKKFLSSEDKRKLQSLKQTDNLSSIWPDFCQWLLETAGTCPNILLVAQQIHHNDEIVLAVEMARNQLQWPSQLTIFAIDPLVSIQGTLAEQRIVRKGSWTVSSVYHDLTGNKNHQVHNAFEDAKSLCKNIQTCWALKMMSNFGFQCPPANLAILSTHTDLPVNLWLFWPTVRAVLGWAPVLAKDNRQSIWSLTNKRNCSPWPRELIQTLEDNHSICTISDLIERSTEPDFETKMKTNDPIVTREWSYIATRLSESVHQKSRTPSPDARKGDS